ncbi:MAG: hypothetical protein IK066_01830, partial [Kiritimatiellae bacterium]|nr:hypothetical protein [Kiritimatiellia bacterium]
AAAGGIRESAQPDVRTASALYAALRQAAVCEEGGRLHLLCGAPPEWLRGEDGFSVKGASTAWGKLDLRARERGKLFRAEIGGEAAPPDGYRLWWPRGEAPERVLAARRATKEFGMLYIDLPGDFKGTVEGFYAEDAPGLRGE